MAILIIMTNEVYPGTTMDHFLFWVDYLAIFNANIYVP